MVWGSYRVLPRLGDIYVKETFAYLPTHLSDGRWVLWEYYFALREFNHWGHSFDSAWYGWQTIERGLYNGW